MIEIEEKSKCCGCSACVAICPFDAITMEEDNQGFLYPKANPEVCINCGKCDRVCPISNKVDEDTKIQRGYLLQHKDDRILSESSSGGAFTAIAQTVIEKGGIVYGAAYDGNIEVIHKSVEKVEELSQFRNSKYVQSKLDNTFREIREWIIKKRLVLFSGTPCQVEGLLSFLEGDTEYLITVDVVCHAVPSPAVWRAYKELVKKDNTGIKSISFRNKDKYGYIYSQMKIQYEDGTSRYEGIEKNIMLRAFFSEICNRPSCYECQFKKRYRKSDITIWDCFDVSVFSRNKLFDQNKGVSRVLVHTDKGKSLFDDTSKYCMVDEVSPDILLRHDAKEVYESVKKNDRYDEFWSSFYDSPEKTLYTFFKITFKEKVESTIRFVVYRVGLYRLVRNTYKRLFGNRKR